MSTTPEPEREYRNGGYVGLTAADGSHEDPLPTGADLEDE